MGNLYTATVYEKVGVVGVLFMGGGAALWVVCGGDRDVVSRMDNFYTATVYEKVGVGWLGAFGSRLFVGRGARVPVEEVGSHSD